MSNSAIANTNLETESPEFAESKYADWLISETGIGESLATEELALPEQPYRLFRFLTELEDILAAVPDDRDRLSLIVPRVRKLLMSSYWLQLEFTEPPVDPGWSVDFLYEDHEFPLTVQMVAWRPGHVSPIHNHGAWGVIALIGGSEKNRIYRRAPSSQYPDRIELVEEKIMTPGEIISFLPNAIHSVEPLGDEPAVTFNLYGETDFTQRFEFDALKHTAWNF